MSGKTCSLTKERKNMEEKGEDIQQHFPSTHLCCSWSSTRQVGNEASV